VSRSIGTYLACILPREYPDMNLHAHIITCSPLSMNLPAYDTTSPDPSLHEIHPNNTHKPLISLRLEALA